MPIARLGSGRSPVVQSLFVLASAVALLTSVAGNADAGTARTPAPSSETCRPAKYPAESLRAGEKGSVVLSMVVTADGSVRSVEVAQSSGFPRLDAAAMTAIRTCRFTPQLVDGVPTEARGLFRYSFAEPSGAPPVMESLFQTIHLQRYISVLSERCQSHFPDLVVALDAANDTWHLHNDELALKLTDYRNRLDALGTVPILSAGAQSLAVQSASFGIAAFEAQTEAEQLAYCHRYMERLSNGSLDLINVVIKFPELEAAIAPSAMEAETP